ncbi:unnamed protein product, partial [Scytosiphon promiscuus]
MAAEGGRTRPLAEGRRPLQRMNSISLNVDNLIEQLLSVRGHGPNAQVNLPEDDIRALCLVARDVLLDQPCLLQLATPMKICGDIHGQYHDLLRLFDHGGHPPDSNYLFLGDYVDRGKHSLETICLLMCYKVKYPDNFFLLRGNHESASINKMYGFYDECKRRYTTKLWRTFTDCFNCLPIAAIVDDKIFCAHGGLSPELFDMEQINRVARPTDTSMPRVRLLCDLLWSDPDRDIIGWGENDRGVSFTFGEDIVRDFLAAHDLDLICRAHQILQSSEKRQRYQRKSSGANRGWLTKGPVGGARLANSSGAESSVVEDPLLGSPPAAEEEDDDYWRRESDGGQDRSYGSHTPETSVPPLTDAAEDVDDDAAAGSTAEAAPPQPPVYDASSSSSAMGKAAILSRESPLNSSGSDNDGGPAAFRALSGDYNRIPPHTGDAGERVTAGGGKKRAASPTPPPGDLGRTAEAAGTPADAAVTTPSRAEEGVVEVGWIGGSAAGGLERVPVVRLPPPAAVPLSDALATRRLADIDGVGSSASPKAEGGTLGPPGAERKAARPSARARVRRPSHRPAEEAAGRGKGDEDAGKGGIDEDDWVNATGDGGSAAGVGGDGGSKARRQHWLNTAASRRGDGRFSSFDGREKADGVRLLRPPNRGSRAARSSSPTDISAAPATSIVGTPSGGSGGGGAAGGQGSGNVRKVVDESDLAILSSDEESVDASVTTDTYEGGSDSSVDLNSNTDQIDPAVLPYVAYGLATPPSRLVNSERTGAGARSGGAAGARREAAAPDRGGDSAGGKSPPPPVVPKAIGSAARPLDSMAELFASHHLQARRPGKEESGGDPRGGGDVGGGGGERVAPSNTVPAAAAPSSGDNRDGGEAPLVASQADVDRAGKISGYHPDSGSGGGGRQPGAELNYSNGSAAGGGGGGTAATDSYENRGSFESIDGDADPNPGIPESRSRSDSEGVDQQRRGVAKSGSAGRRLASWRRFAPRRSLGGDRDGEGADGRIDLDSSSRSLSDAFSFRSDSTRSLTESERRTRREAAARVLGNVRKGASVVWGKVTSDHPDPLPIDK